MKRRAFFGMSGLLMWPISVLAKARQAVPTPEQMEGPFYPVVPIPIRANLIRDAEAINGQPMTLVGHVTDQLGQPMSGVRVEIWQCDGRGVYDHPRQGGVADFDAAFAGFGAQTTDAQGRYAFQTLYPVPYTGRPPHIHVKLWQDEQELLTTQLYLQGQTGGSWFAQQRHSLQMNPQRDSQGIWAAMFTFVI